MKRGDVWEVNLDPTVGAEIKKTRPCILVGRDALARLPLKIIVPITAWDDRFSSAPWHVRIEPNPHNGLSKYSSADTYQVRSLSERRLVRKIGHVEEHVLEAIDQGLRLSLGLN